MGDGSPRACARLLLKSSAPLQMHDRYPEHDAHDQGEEGEDALEQDTLRRRAIDEARLVSLSQIQEVSLLSRRVRAHTTSCHAQMSTLSPSPT
jgi:hypothetical protein